MCLQTQQLCWGPQWPVVTSTPYMFLAILSRQTIFMYFCCFINEYQLQLETQIYQDWFILFDYIWHCTVHLCYLLLRPQQNNIDTIKKLSDHWKIHWVKLTWADKYRLFEHWNVASSALIVKRTVAASPVVFHTPLGNQITWLRLEIGCLNRYICVCVNQDVNKDLTFKAKDKDKD